MKLLRFAIVLCVFAATSSFAETYTIDPDHSNITFKIHHFLGKVQGSFTEFDGIVDYDEKKIDKFQASTTIQTDSIDTHVKKRDEHLKSHDFFDVDNAKHPEFKTIKFESNKFTNVINAGDETKGNLEGKITIHGITKPITLDVVIHGKPILDPMGNQRISMSGTGTLNRKDFGLTWNQAVETGGFIVGDEVELSVDADATHKGPVKKEDKKK